MSARVTRAVATPHGTIVVIACKDAPLHLRVTVVRV